MECSPYWACWAEKGPRGKSRCQKQTAPTPTLDLRCVPHNTVKCHDTLVPWLPKRLSWKANSSTCLCMNVAMKGLLIEAKLSRNLLHKEDKGNSCSWFVGSFSSSPANWLSSCFLPQAGQRGGWSGLLAPSQEAPNEHCTNSSSKLDFAVSSQRCLLGCAV